MSDSEEIDYERGFRGRNFRVSKLAVDKYKLMVPLSEIAGIIVY